NGLETSYPLLLERNQRFGERLTLHFGLGYDQPASENVVLRVAGRRDPLELGLTWHFSRDDRLGAEWNYYRYRAYDDLRIGYGQQVLAQYGHLFRDVALPLRLPLEASAYAGRFSFRDGLDLADARAAEIKQRLFAGNELDAGALRPQGFSLYGVRLATEQPAPGEYVFGMTPYALVGWSHNSVVGPGYELAVGLAGSLFGKDRFSLSARQDKGGDGLFERTSEVSAFYRLFF
ncbi:MAG: hypothetical protein HGA47_16010, partial [Zoogloea sp.]|nr:hypothetical protein [Zoogloea sp.]